MSDDPFTLLDAFAHRAFQAKHKAREEALAATRLIIRHSGNAIRAVHRAEWDTAEDLLAATATSIAHMREILADTPDLAHHNFVIDAVKEYAEACHTLSLVRDRILLLPDDINVDLVSYMLGLAESVGELRRVILDGLRHGRVEDGEGYLGLMDRIYTLLITMDYPDAITGALRRATDNVRGIVERTRGDVTAAVTQQRLEETIRRALSHLSA